MEFFRALTLRLLFVLGGQTHHAPWPTMETEAQLNTLSPTQSSTAIIRNMVLVPRSIMFVSDCNQIQSNDFGTFQVHQK